jgi:pimeloyl-ACP methyl ester carboxylesterase
VPVVLLGHSMGGRAAIGAAGGPNVVAVCALAPWLDGSDPVAQLAGRTVLIAHGDRERWTSPEASYDYALRAKPVAARIARFDVRGAGHFMISRASDWQSLVLRFVLGVTGIEPEDPDMTNAFSQPTPSGLRVELAAH